MLCRPPPRVNAVRLHQPDDSGGMLCRDPLVRRWRRALGILLVGLLDGPCGEPAPRLPGLVHLREGGDDVPEEAPARGEDLHDVAPAPDLPVVCSWMLLVLSLMWCSLGKSM